MTDDGTWSASVGKSEQIIALASKVTDVEQELAHYKVDLALAQEKLKSLGHGANAGGDTQSSGDAYRRPKQQPGKPYVVAPWRLTKEGATKMVNGQTFYWCTGDH